MATRNPSRPLPEVRNQFRSVSDWIGYINDEGACPYNSNHVMKSHRLMRHVPKCEELTSTNLPGDATKKSATHSVVRMEKCPFNSLHRYPAGKQEEHFKECKARAEDLIARIAAGESLEDIDSRYQFRVATHTKTD